MWTYATLGMSQPGDEYPVELHMFSENKANSLVEILSAVAHYHRTGRPLGVGHSVNFGQPWLDESACDHGLVSLPYLDGPELEEMRWRRGEIVRFYWLVPITASESRFKKDFGVEELENALEEARFNYLDPDRASVR